MPAVYKIINWVEDVESDPDAFRSGIEFAIRGLIARCFECRVEPVGTLAARPLGLDADGGWPSVTRTYELCLEIGAGTLPVAPVKTVLQVKCPFAGCGWYAIVDGSLDEARGYFPAHWQQAHGDGDHFKELAG